MTSQDLHADRYGVSSPWRRRSLIGATVLLGAVFSAWLAWTAFSHAEPEVRSELVTYDVLGEHTATAEVSVVVRDEDVTGATCLLRAVAEDHTVVGEASFEPDVTSRSYTQDIRTERRATSVELVGCTTPTQSRPR